MEISKKEKNNSNGKCCLRISTDASQGMRKYMEDEFSICKQSKTDNTAFMGVFDGHGGKEASIYAKEHLFANIKSQPEYLDSDPEKVKDAIRQGFRQTHLEMARVVESWPKRKDGLNSTSGTTATVVIMRDNKLFVAHVGDSAAVLSTKVEDEFHGKELTNDHKPEDVSERARIESLGGKVAVSNNGVHRVVWKRLVRTLALPTPRYEYVPFLAVSRALGDVWSYNHEVNKFIVSPEPEIEVIDFIRGLHKFIIVASDGLWGVMNAQQAVKTVLNYECSSEIPPSQRNCSRHLLNKSLEMWQKRRSRADNITVIVAFFDDEFGEYNYDSDQDADTDVISNNEDDTPPINDSNPQLVRHLAFRNSDNEEANIESPLVEPSIDPLHIPPEQAEPCALGKRKNDNTQCATLQKKVKTFTSLSDESVCNVVASLSSESLVELQLDDELSFADDEADEAALASCAD